MNEKGVVAKPGISRKYTIDVPEFAGPLDLLLHLIDRNELDITEISLAEVTDQYLAQVEKLKEDRVPQLIDFIVVGARMMVIKSRALLPAPPVVLEGEDEEDPAEALLRQLRIYKQFKDAAARLSERNDSGLRTYLRVAPPIKIESKLDLTGVSADSLLLTMIAILNRHEVRRDSVSVARPRTITIGDQIAKLRSTARHGRRFSFGTLLSAEASRVELSVTLLALLELVKRQEVTAEQETLFGPIEINRAEANPEGHSAAE